MLIKRILSHQETSPGKSLIVMRTEPTAQGPEGIRLEVPGRVYGGAVSQVRQHDYSAGFLLGVLILTGILGLGAGIATVQTADKNHELIRASMTGDLQKAERLLREGANVNARFKDGFTALMLASMTNHPAMVKLFLGKGVDVNAKTSHGVTALMLAAGKGRMDIVKLLLASGAEGNAKETSGWTALTHATKNGHEEIRALLLRHGAKE